MDGFEYLVAQVSVVAGLGLTRALAAPFDWPRQTAWVDVLEPIASYEDNSERSSRKQ